MAGKRVRDIASRIYLLFTDSIPDVARLKKNWWIIYLFSFVGGYSWTVVYSSLHQFVTNDIKESNSTQPGLGLDETYYAWIVAAYSIGEFFSALTFGVATNYFKVKNLMMTVTFSLLVGSLLYGTGVSGWMLIVGRCLQGVYSGGGSTLFRIYIGETSNIAMELKGEDKSTSQLKNTNFFIAFGFGTLATGLGPASAAVVAQFPSIDQFRWCGWVLVIASLFEFTVITIYFMELPTDITRNRSRLSLKSLKPAIPIYSMLFFVISFFVINFAYAVIETLVNPILGDNFGLDIEYISYVFVMTISLYAISTVIIFVLQRLGVPNKAICIIGLIVGVIGCLIIADWQSLHGDPCDQYSYENFNTLKYNIFDDMYPQEDTQLNISSSVALCPTNNTALCLSMKECLNHSGPPEECFWNQNSRVTGIFCEECVKLCRSRRTSLNFVQLLIGLLLFTPACPISRITLTILASDGMGTSGQSTVMGVMVATGSVSKIIGPLAGDALMLLAGRRTYLVMIPLSGMFSLVLVGFLVLYRKLSPKVTKPEDESSLEFKKAVVQEFTGIPNNSEDSEENLELINEESEL